MKLTALVMKAEGGHWSLLRDVPWFYLETLEKGDWVVLETWVFPPSVDSVLDIVRIVQPKEYQRV